MANSPGSSPISKLHLLMGSVLKKVQLITKKELTYKQTK
jgi:hypothetical protein